jgi:PAS domain S-box-containing protein
MNVSDNEELSRYRQMVEHSPAFMALLEGPEHRIVFANTAYRKLVGDRDLIGSTVRQAFPEIEGQGFRKLLDDAYRSGKQFIGRGVEVALLRSPGGRLEKRQIDFVYQPVRNADGDVSCILIHGTDITEASQITDNLRIEQVRLQGANADLERMVSERSSEPGATWQVSPYLLSVIDMSDGRFLRVNPAWLPLLGWSEEEVTGKPYVDFVHPHDLSASAAAFEDVIQGLPVLNFENRYRTKRGSYEWLSWAAVPHDGKLYSTTRVITGEREQAIALSKAEEALRQSQKMEAVGQLTGGIAHDFNNMLAVIMGGINLIERRQARNEPFADLIEAVDDGARRAAELVHRLLAFSRQLPLNPQTVDVAMMVKSMSVILRRTLGEQIKLETVLAGGLWKATTDVNQLENAILNLALNARDAMSAGGKLTIETSNAHLDDEYARANDEVMAGQYVLVAVSDTGTGMAADVVERAFDPFFTTKEVGKGTGLGLSQVFGYVKQSGGHIKIYSEVGLGTTIKLYLPRAFEQSNTVRAIEKKVATPGGSVEEAILLVDDDRRMREIAAASLRELGYTVIHASSGAQALEFLKTHPQIVLLLTDIVMPEMNGRKLADEAIKIQPGLRVLFTTGYTRNAVVHNGVLDAGVKFLPKPFTLDQLGRKVRETLS